MQLLQVQWLQLLQVQWLQLQRLRWIGSMQLLRGSLTLQQVSSCI